jgi:hypothetical protein
MCALDVPSRVREEVRLVVAGQGLHLEKEMEHAQTEIEDKFSRAAR